jgi:hypothetical protein
MNPDNKVFANEVFELPILHTLDVVAHWLTDCLFSFGPDAIGSDAIGSGAIPFDHQVIAMAAAAAAAADDEVVFNPRKRPVKADDEVVFNPRKRPVKASTVAVAAANGEDSDDCVVLISHTRPVANRDGIDLVDFGGIEVLQCNPNFRLSGKYIFRITRPINDPSLYSSMLKQYNKKHPGARDVGSAFNQIKEAYPHLNLNESLDGRMLCLSGSRL